MSKDKFVEYLESELLSAAEKRHNLSHHSFNVGGIPFREKMLMAEDKKERVYNRLKDDPTLGKYSISKLENIHPSSVTTAYRALAREGRIVWDHEKGVSGGWRVAPNEPE